MSSLKRERNTFVSPRRDRLKQPVAPLQRPSLVTCLCSLTLVWNESFLIRYHYSEYLSARNNSDHCALYVLVGVKAHARHCMVSFH